VAQDSFPFFVHDEDLTFLPAESDPDWAFAPVDSVFLPDPADGTLPPLTTRVFEMGLVAADKHEMRDFHFVEDWGGNFIQIVTPLQEVGVTSIALMTDPAPGDLLFYQDSVTNGRGQAVTTTLTHPVPAGSTFSVASQPGWGCLGSVCSQVVSLAAEETKNIVVDLGGVGAIAGVSSIPERPQSAASARTASSKPLTAIDRSSCLVGLAARRTG